MIRYIPIGVALLLAGCGADGGFAGSLHAYSGQVSTPLADVQGVPTVYHDGTNPMGYRQHPDGYQEDMYSTVTVKPTGEVVATGQAAVNWSKGHLCAIAPAAPECSTPAQ